jgi:hypothetical protein
VQLGFLHESDEYPLGKLWEISSLGLCFLPTPGSTDYDPDEEENLNFSIDKLRREKIDNPPGKVADLNKIKLSHSFANNLIKLQSLHQLK